MNEIFTPWEGYSQYTPEQIQYLRDLSYNKTVIDTTKENIAEVISSPELQEWDEEWEYILGLA